MKKNFQREKQLGSVHVYLGLLIQRINVVVRSCKNKVKVIIFVVSNIAKGKICMRMYLLLFQTRSHVDLQLVEKIFDIKLWSLSKVAARPTVWPIPYVTTIFKYYN